MNNNWGLVGHDHQVGYLKSSIDSRAVFHAYILNGPRHSGKMTLAVKFAQALNCLSGSSPCSKCEICRRIVDNIYPDIHITRIEANDAEVRSKTGITVEQIRTINHIASLPPYEGQHSVFIIEDADKMSTSGSNALLKTLEEPAAHQVFILITTNLAGIPETIRSRCQVLNLGVASEYDIRNFLIRNYNTTSERAELLSRLCEGLPGWAVAAFGDDCILQKRENDVSTYIDLLESDFKSKFDTANIMAGLMNSKREEVYLTLDHWASFSRDILLCRLNVPDMVVNIAFSTKAKTLAEYIDLDNIRLMIHSIIKTNRYLGLNVNPKLTLETLILGLPLLGGLINRHA